MQTFEYTVQLSEGLHARPAGLLVKYAQSCNSEVQISYHGKTVNAKRLFAIMGLGIKQNEVMTIQVEGDNEAAECSGLKAFFQKNL